MKLHRVQRYLKAYRRILEPDMEEGSPLYKRAASLHAARRS